ncbi:MAG: hypothetical protein Q9181_006752 [Wetmoreana brouardii]
MAVRRLILALLVSTVTAFPLDPRDGDPKIAAIIASAKVPKYTPSTTTNRDITDWLAIGDSFSAGISADIPDDELNWSCSRFKKSYPNQMNENPRFPGHSTSRTFVFGACTGGKMQDLIDHQIELGDPDLEATYPKIGRPQIGTVSISGNDLKFGAIVNACLYHWVGYGDCTQLLKDAHTALDDPGKVFEYKVIDVFVQIMVRARRANPSFQLYVTGYIQFWNHDNTQCDQVSWAPWYKAKAYLTTTLRKDMNSLVDKLNNLLKQAADSLSDSLGGGIYYVDGFQEKFDGHRFCEQEDDPNYHNNPISERTWFIHYNSPYKNPTSVTGFGNGSFFDQVNSILIPEKEGKSTEDQIKEVNGDLAKLNDAYKDYDSMTAALTKLGEDDVKYQMLPITWIRVMHPKGSGYTPMADAVIDNVLRYYGASGEESGNGGTPSNPNGLKCTGIDNKKFMGRDDMNDKIGKFCADAAAQKVQDKDSGSTVRKYNEGTRYEVIISMDWPSGQDISHNMEENCKNYMTSIMDDCDGNDDKNPLNWKHGGYNQVDKVRYNIIPTQDQGYTPGTCSFHLQEDEQWSGIDGPGTERHWHYQIEKALMKDHAGNEIGRLGFKKNSGDGEPQSEGDKNPLNWQTKLPQILAITSEAQGHPRDYVQFTIGSQSWKTSDPDTGTPRCNVGGWSSDYSPADRNMDCFFKC